MMFAMILNLKKILIGLLFQMLLTKLLKIHFILQIN